MHYHEFSSLTLCLTLLLYTHTVLGSQDCGVTSSTNCSFSEQPCDWHRDHWKNAPYETYPEPRQFFALLSDSKVTGKLTSTLACSTGGETHCLQLSFYVGDIQEGQFGGVAVFLNPANEIPRKVWGWSRSTSGRWLTVRVSLTMDEPFVIVILASRKTHKDPRLAVDNIRYYKSKCKTWPATTSTTTTTTTRSAATTTTIAATEAATPSPSEEETTTSSDQSAIAPDSEKQSDGDPESPDQVAGIVGAVAAILVTLAIVALALAVCRHKAVFLWKKEGREGMEDTSTSGREGRGHSAEANKTSSNLQPTIQLSSEYDLVAVDDDGSYNTLDFQSRNNSEQPPVSRAEECPYNRLAVEPKQDNHQPVIVVSEGETGTYNHLNVSGTRFTEQTADEGAAYYSHISNEEHSRNPTLNTTYAVPAGRRPADSSKGDGVGGGREMNGDAGGLHATTEAKDGAKPDGETYFNLWQTSLARAPHEGATDDRNRQVAEASDRHVTPGHAEDVYSQVNKCR